MRFLSSLIAVALLVVACGADGSDVVDDGELAALKEEVAELRAELDAANRDEHDDADSLRMASLDEAYEFVYDSVDIYTGLPWSEGPCGVFRLDGTRILELVPILDEDGYPDYENQAPWEWVDSGIDYLELLPEKEAYFGEWWLRRPPSMGLVGKVLYERNSFFWLHWGWEDRTLELPPDIQLLYSDGIRGANRISFSGVFGPNENCEWGWVPVLPSEGDWHNTFVPNASVVIVYKDRPEGSFAWDSYSDPWFGVFDWKDYTCPFETRYAIAVYDPTMHAFLSTCSH